MHFRLRSFKILDGSDSFDAAKATLSVSSFLAPAMAMITRIEPKNVIQHHLSKRNRIINYHQTPKYTHDTKIGTVAREPMKTIIPLAKL
jgi:hypothetical protein